MAAFRDLSEYSYFPWEQVLKKLPAAPGVARPRPLLNIGWLSTDQPYRTGAFASDLLRCLAMLCTTPVNRLRGWHVCELCDSPPVFPMRVEVDGVKLEVGNGEVHVEGEGGRVYSAPTMIVHYIQAHSYTPPDEFTAALRFRCAGEQDHLTNSQ